MTTSPCRHHWLIASPDGRTWLPAVCRRCGAQREYLAGGEYGWGNYANTIDMRRAALRANGGQ